MKLFIKKVTQHEMGLVINEMTRLRSDEVINEMSEYGFEGASKEQIQIITFIYNLYFSRNRLMSSYANTIVENIICDSIGVFNKRLATSGFSEDEIVGINNLLNDVFKMMYEFSNLDYSPEPFDNVVRQLAKFYVGLINKNPDPDEGQIMEIAILLGTWIKFTEFLIEEYKITS